MMPEGEGIMERECPECVGGGSGVPGRRAALSQNHEWFTPEGGGEYAVPNCFHFFLFCNLYCM